MKKKSVIAKSFFAFLSILLVPIYTLIFGTKKSPFEYTLSNIGNFFNHRVSFILWGIITGLLLVVYILYTYKKAQYSDKKSVKFLIWSDLFLCLTVLTPAIKDIMPFWYYMHVVYSVLFVVFLVVSIQLFIHYLFLDNKKASKKAYIMLMSVVAIPLLLLFLIGFNGLVEIAFFICISIFLIVLNIYLNSNYAKINYKYFKRQNKGGLLWKKSSSITQKTAIQGVEQKYLER